MILNRFEFVLMNNPVRAAIQRRLEARWLLELGGAMSGGRALEVGCGRGVGTELILDAFGADSVDAFDLDPRMVEQARRRLARRGDAVRLWVGDVTAIDAPDASYDAVFDFGIIHHVPDWRAAFAEVSRVLVPGGTFYCEEVLRDFVDHPMLRRLFDHPRDDRFGVPDLEAGLRAADLEPLGQRTLLGSFVWIVARKAGARS